MARWKKRRSKITIKEISFLTGGIFSLILMFIGLLWIILSQSFNYFNLGLIFLSFIILFVIWISVVSEK